MSTLEDALYADLRDLANTIDTRLQTILGHRTGFCVLVFDTGNNNESRYLSNVTLETSAKYMQSFLEGLKEGIVRNPQDPVH